MAFFSEQESAITQTIGGRLRSNGSEVGGIVANNTRVPIRVRVFIALLIAACALTSGALIASNMGHTITVTLDNATVGVSKSGVNTINLPYDMGPNIVAAKPLMDDIGLASVDSLQRFVKSTDTYSIYTGRPPSSSANNFPLTAGECYFVRMRTTTAYTIVGAERPSTSIVLHQPTSGVSKSGLNFVALPFNITAGTAKQLMDDIGLASVDSVQRFVKSSDTYQIYTGRPPNSSANNFPLKAGECYFVRMRTTTTYSPSHY
jgi:hypothetical protein